MDNDFYFNRPANYQSFPVVKSPLVCNRTRSRQLGNGAHSTQRDPQILNIRRFLHDEVVSTSRKGDREHKIIAAHATVADRHLHRISSNDCYETAFTTAEPKTRIVSQSHATISRRSPSFDCTFDKESDSTLGFQGFCREKNHESSYIYHSLDRLRSKSGGYVNVAAFGSVDCLDRSNPDRCSESAADLWMTSNPTVVHSRSISSLSCHHGVTGLSPSFSDSSLATTTQHNYENLPRLSEKDSPYGLNGQLLVYRNSPSKRLIGRRKGLEFYYGAKACRPGNPLRLNRFNPKISQKIETAL